MKIATIERQTVALSQVLDWHAANCGMAVLLDLAAQREDGSSRPELKFLADACKEAFTELEDILRPALHKDSRPPSDETTAI